MALKVSSIEKRFGKIASYLETQEGNAENDPSRLLAEAYQWFYSTGRHDRETPHPDDWAVYHLANHNSFDAILTGHSVLIFNEIQWARRRKETEALQAAGKERMLGPPSSRVSISPTFDALYAMVPKRLQGQVAERLKSLALSTTAHDKFKKHIKIKDNMPCVEVAPGVDLVAEMEGSIGVCFLGFRFSAYKRPIAQNVTAASKVVVGAFALSLGLLMASLIVVPYDVVLTGKGPRLQVFAGYTPVWSSPDIQKACEWYLDEDLDKGGVAYRNCYSRISLPRAVLGSGAALVLTLSLFFLLRVVRRPVDQGKA